MTRASLGWLLLLVTASLSAETTASARPALLPDDLPLIDSRTVSFAALANHIRTANPDIDEIYLSTLYRHYREICRAEGVSLLVVLAQMTHETDYLRFSGSVRAVQYNYAGLGATSASQPGVAFPDMRTGVAAHVQHVKAYADDLPLATPLVDPRFGLVARGSADTVRDLTGRWATDPGYGRKVLAHARALLAQEP